MSGKGVSVRPRRSELSTRTEIRKRSGRATSSVRLFFFVFLTILAAAAAAPSQDLDTLAKQLHSGSTEEKRTVLMQLRSARSEEASRVAVAGLSDADAIVRATAASSVTFLPKGEASAALSPLLNDKDEFVRKEAAYSLGEVGDPASVPQLIRRLNSDKSPEVRVAAAVAIGKLGSLDAVLPLVAILGQRPNEANEVLRRAVARSIGQIPQIMRSGRLQVVTPQNFLPDKYKDIGPKPSPEMLSHFSTAVSVLTRVLDSTQETDDTRREAAFALGAIGDNTARGVLAKYVSSTDPYLAEICKEALLKLKAGE